MKRIQRKRTKGWTMPEGAVYVGRGTKWGNPYRVGQVLGPFIDGPKLSAENAVRNYRWWLVGQIVLGKLDLDEIRGKDLACWCLPDQPCHADVLIEYCNRCPGCNNNKADIIHPYGLCLECDEAYQQANPPEKADYCTSNPFTFDDGLPF